MNVKEYFENDIACEDCKFAEFCQRHLLGSHPSALDWDPFCSEIDDADGLKDVDVYYNETLQKCHGKDSNKVFAKENVTFNFATRIGTIDGYPVFTSKVATSEGTYRLFIYHPYKGGGITAVKIK